MQDPAVEADNSHAAYVKTRVKDWAEGAVAEHGQMFIDLMRVELNEWERRLRGPNVEGTADVMDADAMRQGKELLKAGDARTSYAIFDEATRRNDAQQVLVTWQDVKAVMDKHLHVGQITSPQGDGSRPYAVFSKRDAAVAVAQLVNDRFNAKRVK